VNGDGYPDIVAFDAGNNAILVYINKSGVFSTPTALSINDGSVSSIAVGDVNGDGKVDIVTIASNFLSQTQSSVTVETYLGVGDGTFTLPTTALIQTIMVNAQVQFPQNLGITLGDVNKDGKLDIAALFEERTSQTDGQIVATIGIGKGDGTFGALNVTNPISVPVSSTPFYIVSSAGVQIVDLNGDGNADLAIDTNSAGQDSLLVVALGNGSGGFSTPVQTVGFSGSNQIVYADVTGDGIPDAIQTSGLLNIWTGNGDGTFNAYSYGSSYNEDSGASQSLTLADYNGDGNVDIAQLGSDYKQLSLFAGNGKGSFYGAPIFVSPTELPPDPLALSVGDVADVEGKGVSSAILLDTSGAAPVVVSAVSDGKAKFTYVVGLDGTAYPALGYIEPVHGDYNGDGKQDLLMAGTDGTMAVALSNGDGTFGSPKLLGLPKLDCEIGYAAIGDLNGDGKVDIAVAYIGDAACGGADGTASGYFVALGNGDGTFQTPVFTASGAELYSVAIADMNLDGNPDLIVDDAPFQVGGTFAVSLLPGNGDGTFGEGTVVKSGELVSQVIAGDYNSDGKPDLILFSEGEQTDTDTYSTAGILLVPGRGDGTFGAASQIGTGNFFLNGSLSDVNNDGIPDIVASLYQTIGQPDTFYGLSTLLGTGGGSFSAPVNTLQSLASTLPLPGNFYNDNAIDFVANTGYGTALYLGQGGTSLTLSTSAAAAAFGASETLTAAVAPSISGSPAATGTVSFYDGQTLLGTVAVSGGSASYSTSLLSVGAHTISAEYSGDGNFNPNTSSSATVTVSAVTPAFTLSATPTSASITGGQNGIALLELAANATFADTVKLACSGAPTNATCTISPASVTLAAGGSATASLILATSGTSTQAVLGPSSGLPFGPSGVITVAALIGMLFLPRSRRLERMGLFVLLLVAGGAGLTGCSGGGSSSNNNSVPTVAPGTYSITVTATPATSGAAAQTATFSVTVN